MQPGSDTARAPAGWALVWIGLTLACVQPGDLDGRPCPCAEQQGFVCCGSTRRCVRPEELASPACPPAIAPAPGAQPPRAGGAVNPDPAPAGAPDAGESKSGPAPGIRPDAAVSEVDAPSPPPDGPSPPPDVWPLPPVNPADGPASASCTEEPRGVRAFYWDDTGHAGFMVSRQEPQFSFNWSDGPPDPSFDPDSVWSAVFATQLQPQISGDYTFFVAADD